MVSAADFLRSLDLFVYSFGPFFKESWRACDSRRDVDWSDSSDARGVTTLVTW